MLTRLSKRLTEALKRAPRLSDDVVVANVRTMGFHVVRDFLSADLCQDLVEAIDELIVTRADKVQHEHAEGTSGDFRLFGAETQLPVLRQAVADNLWLQSVASSYMRQRVVTHFVMANKVVHTPGIVCNSGAGWHRDSGRRQFKAIVYLTDVSPLDGPFCIIPASYGANLTSRQAARNRNRFDDQTIEEHVRRNNTRIQELVGPAGTCILVDTSNVHRGKNIEQGSRYALTNYYYEDTPERRHKTQEKWGQYLLAPVA